MHSPATPVVITTLEKRRLIALILALIAATSLPYLWAAGITPPNFRFVGLLFNPDDQNVHLMWARQAMEGKFFFSDMLTTENISSGEKPLFTNLFCWLIGIIAKLTHLPLVGIYHGLRVLGGGLVLWAFYNLCARLTPHPSTRLLATALAGFSCGGGWLRHVLPFGGRRIWMDQPEGFGYPMIPEAFGYPSLLIFPLNTFSFALLAVIYGCVLRAQSGEKRALGIGALSALLLANIHTYDALPLLVTLGLWSIFSYLRADAPQSKMSMAAPPLLIGAGALPATLYQLYVFRNSSEFRLKALTPTPPPPLLDVLLSYGPLLALAIGGAWLLRRHKDTYVLMIWPVVALSMIYIPQFSFGRKMIEGTHLPLCFLAAVAIVAIARKVPNLSLRRVTAVALAAMLCVSSVQFVAWCLQEAPRSIWSRVAVLMPPLYLPEGDAQAMQFLEDRHRQEKAQGKPQRAVLCMPMLGNFVPRFTGYHAFVGHWAETLHFFDEKTRTGKIVDTQNFYSGKMTEAQAVAWMKKNHIAYVIEGIYEHNMFKAPLPSRIYNWTPIFKSEGTPENPNGTAVYAVP